MINFSLNSILFNLILLYIDRRSFDKSA